MRFTKGIDLVILPDDLDKVKDALSDIGYCMSSGLIPFKREDGSFQEIARITQTDDKQLVVLDLVLCTGHLERVWQDRSLIELEGKMIKIVSKEGLINMKRSAGRSQDLVDIEKIEDEKWTPKISGQSCRCQKKAGGSLGLA